MKDVCPICGFCHDTTACPPMEWRPAFAGTNNELQRCRDRITALEKSNAELRLQLETLWANCKVVYWDRRNTDAYPIEHNAHAKKYNRDAIEAALLSDSEREGK